MNAAAEQVITTLGKIPLTASELLQFLPYPEFCDCDVCERIIFRTKTPLQSVYYLKAHKKKALEVYIQSNWHTIHRMIQNSESGSFPPTLAKAITKHIDSKISFLEGDLCSLQDEVADIEAKIEEYESLRL